MAEKTANRKKYLVMLSVTLGTALLICTVMVFPVTRFNGERIKLFAPEKLASWSDYGYTGKVLGDHILKTEHGEITLKNSAMVMAIRGNIVRISVDNFTAGLASHTLVVEGIEIPPNITIGFRSNPNRISILRLDYQEVTVSSIPIKLERIQLRYPESGADIAMLGTSFSQIHIVLADSTELNMERFFGFLNMYQDSGQWELEFPGRKSSFLVKLPGETESTRYRSVTFGENWGAFIEGELFVPEDPEAERERMDKMLNDLSNSISTYGSRN